MRFLGKENKKLFFEAWRWKLGICALVTLVAEIGIWHADVIPVINRFYVGIYLFFWTYLLTFMGSCLVWGLKTLKSYMGTVRPLTEYTERNTKKMKHNFVWWLNFWLGILLFIIFFDVVIVLGILLGFLILMMFGDFAVFWLEFRYGASRFLTPEGLMTEEFWALMFSGFLLFVLFAGYYGKVHALADWKLRLKEKINPWLVFKTAVFMMWTMGHGEDAQKKERKFDLAETLVTFIPLLLVGWAVDHFANSWYLARIILSLLGVFHEIIVYSFKIDRYVKSVDKPKA